MADGLGSGTADSGSCGCARAVADCEAHVTDY